MSYSIIQFLNNSMGPILQGLALGNYRHDIAYTAALKSTLAWAPIVLAQGNYRHDIAYTAALKSTQTTPLSLAQGSYRYDIAYTAALKSIQTLAKGSYRQDIAYTGALKSVPHGLNLDQKTGATHPIVAPVFCFNRIFIFEKGKEWPHDHS
jgi:hypothetical protein